LSSCTSSDRRQRRRNSFDLLREAAHELRHPARLLGEEAKALHDRLDGRQQRNEQRVSCASDRCLEGFDPVVDGADLADRAV
jgi:hypothetical protein